MDINQAFGLALRDIRFKKGVSQEKLGSAVSRVYISSLERGLRNPTLSTIDKLAKELGIHPLELLINTYAILDDRDPEEMKNLISVLCAKA